MVVYFVSQNQLYTPFVLAWPEAEKIGTTL
ncbi:uncharacterized protein METZ01_LOCUS266493 [marine metagenome]|uniref:Uncharacterized protein n=1 Tax=marine metagenome TaxID=408172 RepID=A0A382JPI1_9ZZZZ